MDTNEIRRVKLRQLIDERYDGKVARLAAFLDMKPPQLHRWLSGGQGVHENSARAIERDCGLPPGWLDLPPDAPPSALPEPSNVSATPEPTVADLLERLRAEIATQPEAVKRAIAELMAEYVTTPDEATGRAVADAILRILGPRP
jgi:DnaJ-domain-containing protein 1